MVLYIFYIILSQTRLLPRLPFSSEKEADEPILASRGLLGSKRLQSLQQGTYAGFQYNLLINGAGKVIMYVQLGYNSEIHMVAIGDKSGVNDHFEKFSSKFLVAVNLEGDFPNYFRMFCSPNKQIELREVFEPVTMTKFIDFCRAYDLEIFNDTLYISQAEKTSDSKDTTSMVADVQNFLENHRQLLERL